MRVKRSVRCATHSFCSVYTHTKAYEAGQEYRHHGLDDWVGYLFQFILPFQCLPCQWVWRRRRWLKL